MRPEEIAREAEREGGWRSLDADPPPPGTRFVCLFSDGSGAWLGLRDDAGTYYDGEDGDSILVGEGSIRDGGLWHTIPDDAPLWGFPAPPQEEGER